jgi:hypothetical protein
MYAVLADLTGINTLIASLNSCSSISADPVGRDFQALPDRTLPDLGLCAPANDRNMTTIVERIPPPGKLPHHRGSNVRTKLLRCPSPLVIILFPRRDTRLPDTDPADDPAFAPPTEKPAQADTVPRPWPKKAPTTVLFI